MARENTYPKTYIMGNCCKGIMVEICEVKGCNEPVKMHHFEKKNENGTNILRHICNFHYNQIKENGVEPEYEGYITHKK
jgi:hypothetical protein